MTQTVRMFLSGKIAANSVNGTESPDAMVAALIEAGRENACEATRDGARWVMDLPSWESKLVAVPSRWDMGAGLADRMELVVAQGTISYRWLYWSRQQVLLHVFASAMILIGSDERSISLLALVNLAIFAISFATVQHSWGRVLATFRKKTSR